MILRNWSKFTVNRKHSWGDLNSISQIKCFLFFTIKHTVYSRLVLCYEAINIENPKGIKFLQQNSSSASNGLMCTCFFFYLCRFLRWRNRQRTPSTDAQPQRVWTGKDIGSATNLCRKQSIPLILTEARYVTVWCRQKQADRNNKYLLVLQENSCWVVNLMRLH